MREKDAVYLRLQGTMKTRFSAIKTFLALENDTEICRTLINDYYFRNKQNLEPQLLYYLANPNGVFIADLQLNKLIRLENEPNKPLYCPHCKSTNCQHTQLARSTPAIQEHIKQQK